MDRALGLKIEGLDKEGKGTTGCRLKTRANFTQGERIHTNTSSGWRQSKKFSREKRGEKSNMGNLKKERESYGPAILLSMQGGGRGGKRQSAGEQRFGYGMRHTGGKQSGKEGGTSYTGVGVHGHKKTGEASGERFCKCTEKKTWAQRPTEGREHGL